MFKVSFFDFLMEQLIDSVDEFTEKFLDCAEESSCIVSNIENMIPTNRSLNGVQLTVGVLKGDTFRNLSK